MQQQVVFIILSLANKNRIVCDLTEKFYNQGKRILIFAEPEQVASDLDKMLWTWKQSSFIPHEYRSELNTSTDEPVVITQSLAENNRYDVLIQVTPAPDTIRKQFTLVVDFAEKYDINALERSRERYRRLQQENVSLKSMQAGEFMHAPV
jgi:DNA polymerase-3 subunit chi